MPSNPHRAAPWLRALLALALALPLWAFQPRAVRPVQAAGVFTVNTTDDSNNPDESLSLREAVLVANGVLTNGFGAGEQAQLGGCFFDGGGGIIVGSCGAGVIDTIILPAGTYGLSELPIGDDTGALGDWDLTESVILTGAGAATLIDAGGQDRVFHILGAGTVVTMTGLTVAGGNAGAGNGGAIFNAGTLVLSGVSVGAAGQGSLAVLGGGVYNTGLLTATSSSFISNTATTDGGGLYTALGSQTFLSATSLLSNTAASDGGGFYNLAALALTGGQVSGNAAAFDGAGGYNDAGLTVSGAAVGSPLLPNAAARDGGGLYNSVSGTLTLTVQAGLSYNLTTRHGGGLYNAGAASLASGSEVFGNQAATGHGGGVYNAGLLVLDAARIGQPGAGNVAVAAGGNGGGLHNATGAVLTVTQGATFDDNVAGNNGDGLYNTGLAVVDGDSQVISNTAMAAHRFEQPSLRLAKSSKTGTIRCSIRRTLQQ